MFALGVLAVGVALLWLVAEAHLTTTGVITIRAIVALAEGVALIVIGASADVLVVVGISRTSSNRA
jgi:hypothetical protein